MSPFPEVISSSCTPPGRCSIACTSTTALLHGNIVGIGLFVESGLFPLSLLRTWAAKKVGVIFREIWEPTPLPCICPIHSTIPPAPQVSYFEIYLDKIRDLLDGEYLQGC